MLLLDNYLDFLVNFKDSSIIGRIRRIYDYYTFHKVTAFELVDIYEYDVYRMLNDFVYLYSALDLFFKLSTYEEFTKEIFLDMKKVHIESEHNLLKETTTYYSLLFTYEAIKLTWNDKDYEVEDEGWGHRYWSKTSRHDGLVIDTASGIVRFMNQVLRKFWFTLEKDINYQSIYILSIEIEEFKLNISNIKLANSFNILLDVQCQYLHINDHKFKELIPIIIQIEDDVNYQANVKLAITYINYRIEEVKTTYNPYIVEYIESHKDKIVQLVGKIVNDIKNI